MKKASNIDEIYRVFTAEMALTEAEKEFYIDLYGIDLQKFVKALQNNPLPNKFFYISGQSGNGKSTALNLLTEKNPDLKNIYDFHHIEGKDVFLNNEIEIVDIFLIIGYTLVEKSEKLKESYIQKLKDISDVKDGSLVLEQKSLKTSSETLALSASLGVGVKFLSILKAGVDFLSSYKMTEEIRKDARRLFTIKRKELVELTNEIILEYKLEKDNDKNLVIVLDNLEKLNYKDSLFLEDMDLLNQLNVVKIITMPIYLHRNENISYATIHEFSLKLYNMNGDKNQKDRDLLLGVILSRVSDAKLMTDDAKEMIVTYSAGNLRQLMRIVSESAMDAMVYDSSKISKKNVEAAIEVIGRQLSPKVMMMRGFLQQIKDTGKHDDSEESRQKIAKSSKMQLVFAHFNGVVWYEINPIISYALEVYGRKHENISH